jgi:hypothetical protein
MKALLILASLTGNSELPNQQLAEVMCFSAGEDDSGAFHKICYYDCLGDRVAITISSTKLCPTTIQQ